MQTEKDLFKSIKEAYSLNPREEFVASTSLKLKQLAKKKKRKKKINQFSIASTTIAICLIAIALFFSQAEKDVISNYSTALQEKNIDASTPFTNEEPVVYIYQTHNLESFYSASKTNDSKETFQETQNITLVGERLSQSLKAKGISTSHDKTNIMGILQEKNLTFKDAYDISREPLEKALAIHTSIQMVFDIHRDSAKREVTTVNLDGIDYPKIAFIVSKSNSNFEENYKFATLLHHKVEEAYPNVSRGVHIKNKPIGQITYNQDLFGNAVLLEIGGIENTLEEEYRTVDIFADILQDLLVK